MLIPVIAGKEMKRKVYKVGMIEEMI